MEVDRCTLIAYHDAALTIIGRALDIAIRPPGQRSGLRLFRGDIFTDDNDHSPEGLESMAVVALAGHFALARIQDGAGDRDELLAQDLVFAGLYARYGAALQPGFVRTYIRSRLAELNQGSRSPGRHALEPNRARSQPARTSAPSRPTRRQSSATGLQPDVAGCARRQLNASSRPPRVIGPR